jgi:hypothetical protein
VGAFEEARAEAARRDLALAALSARGQASDDLVRIALRSARPWDDDVLRVLLADLAAALPPEQAARHEDDLLRTFQHEQNPLILALALPALERLEPPRLRALVEAQLEVAGPEMVPVLAGIARDRLGPEELRSVGISVFEGPAEAGGGR